MGPYFCQSDSKRENNKRQREEDDDGDDDDDEGLQLKRSLRHVLSLSILATKTNKSLN